MGSIRQFHPEGRLRFIPTVGAAFYREMLFICWTILTIIATVSTGRLKREILITKSQTPPEMIRANGYPAETHKVTTDDGYILEMHRIPHGIIQSASPRPALFLQHCIFCSSADWLMNYPKKALGYMLADAGYDVWMGNSRGNTYSRKHIEMEPESQKFWKFSLSEVALYDVPNSIDYILNVTKLDKLSYIGFSMGSLVFFAMLSEKPEFNDKITTAAIMGPSCYMSNAQGLIPSLSPFVNHIEKFFDVIGVQELFPAGEAGNMFTSTFCSQVNFFLFDLCKSAVSTVIDVNDKLINREFLPMIFAHLPAGSSVRTLIHYMQIKNAQRFQKYDYGPMINIEKYGSLIPPAYNLKKAKVPVGLFYGDGDNFINIKDLNRLTKEISNVAMVHRIPVANFTHFDFLWSRDADKMLYKDVIKFLNAYQ